ncbi:MAG: GDSL-type esterase/lipase family protein [Candidatus Omnitrophota bacterium]
MVATNLKQKFGLLLFGLLLTLFLLEVGLRAGGLFFNLVQERTNRVTLSSSEFRVLCIGESTTILGGENSYPSQLEEMLNRRGLDLKFKVINKGLVSKTSKEILLQLEENLKKYRPDVVVAMLGINDQFSERNVDGLSYHLRNFLEKLRVYRLGTLLKAHLNARFKQLRPGAVPQKPSSREKGRDDGDLSEYEFVELDEAHNNPVTPEPEKIIEFLSKIEIRMSQLADYWRRTGADDDSWERKEMAELKIRQSWLVTRLGRYYRLKKDYPEAEKYLKLSFLHYPKGYWSFLELGRLYRDQKLYLPAMENFKKSIEYHPTTKLGYMELGRCYNEIGEHQKAHEMFMNVFKLKPEDVWIYAEIAGWLKEHGYYQDAEQAYLEAMTRNEGEYALYEQLAQTYRLQGKEKEARQILRKANRRGNAVRLYAPSTVRHYNQIVDMVRAEGIPLICMQYPLMGIEVLKNALWRHRDVLFVENKENFEKALQDFEYAKYFSDNFAADFGHCTREGNRLIAENLADVIINKIIAEQRKEDNGLET